MFYFADQKQVVVMFVVFLFLFGSTNCHDALRQEIPGIMLGRSFLANFDDLAKDDNCWKEFNKTLWEKCEESLPLAEKVCRSSTNNKHAQ